MVLSRQREWQLAKIAQGLCSICGTEPIADGQASRCVGCREKLRNYMRKKLGCKPWRRGRRGRPPSC